jgi:hypothetical protein
MHSEWVLQEAVVAAQVRDPDLGARMLAALSEALQTGKHSKVGSAS